MEDPSGNLTDLLTAECAFTVRNLPLKLKRAALQRYSEECALGVRGEVKSKEHPSSEGKVKGPHRWKYEVSESGHNKGSSRAHSKRRRSWEKRKR
ncbi:hypothetical protein AVEN_171757-1 [Araneus ventricosus]|uniref:Uncharacterized protein n=1 Tax=Araneus ventricosus TaxID=182803 RepID=A0A4Y2E0H9_ARAVE|nr:hypothetical protein AVEN_273351-1 [Araneus ventricosus]GBM22689.1 hypothetical protein AVEN_171757-1 [Araneus ventricosus]